MQKRRRRIGVAFLIFLLVGASGWILGWSSLLDVRQIKVVGIAASSPLKSDVVITNSGIRIGEPIARLSGASVKRELGQVPRIASVSLIRKWPHTVVLVIKERVPVAAISKGTQFQLIDGEGHEYASVSSMPIGVPMMMITGDYELGLKTAMSVITSLPPAISGELAQIESSGADGVKLTLRGGVQIVWGDSQDPELKSRVLTMLLAGAGASRFKTFNVSAPYAPTAY